MSLRVGPFQGSDLLRPGVTSAVLGILVGLLERASHPGATNGGPLGFIVIAVCGGGFLGWVFGLATYMVSRAVDKPWQAALTVLVTVALVYVALYDNNGLAKGPYYINEVLALVMSILGLIYAGWAGYTRRRQVD